MKHLPNCKLNIGLRVVRKREDGYHDIDTVFYPVYGLYDELEVEQAESLSFEQEGIAVDCKAEDNLILRCYRLMASRYPQIGNVRIRFKKNIPFGEYRSAQQLSVILVNCPFPYGLQRYE